MDKRIKVILLVITIILSVVATINLSVSLYAKEQKTYKIELEATAIINNLYIDDHKQDLEQLEGDALKYKEKNNGYLEALEDTIISINISKISNISISFNDKSKVNIKEDGLTQKINKDDVFYDSVSILNIIGYSISFASIIYFIVFFIIIFICLYFISRFLSKLKDETVKVKDIILYLFSLFLIFIFTIYILLTLFKTLIVIPIIAFLVYGILKIKNTSKKLEYAYIFIFPVVAISFCFLIPPLNVPDEEAHFIKSYELLDLSSFDDEGVAKLPDKVYAFVTSHKFTNMDSTEKFNGKNYLAQYLDSFNYKDRGEATYSYKNTKFSSSIPYLPSGIVMAIGKLFGLSSLNLLSIGRFINLLITCLMGYLALKVTPYFKKIFFLVLLLPSTIQHSAAINMDWLTIATSILLIAFLLKYIYQKEMLSRKEYIILISLSILLGFCKFGYFPLIILTLLIPNSKISKEKYKAILIKIGLILLPIIISFLTNTSIGGTITGTTKFYTISYSLTHPIDAFMVYLNTAFNRLGTDILQGHFDGFGVYTKWNKPFITLILTILYGILILVHDKDDKTLKLKERIVLIISSLAIMLIVYTAMYLGWTNLGLESIEGLQPRYFIVANLLLFIALSNNKLILKVKNSNLLYNISIVFIYFVSLTTILYGFY